MRDIFSLSCSVQIKMRELNIFLFEDVLSDVVLKVELMVRFTLKS